MVKTKLALTILGVLLGAAVAGATLSISAQAFMIVKASYLQVDRSDAPTREGPEPAVESYFGAQTVREPSYNSSRSKEPVHARCRS